MNVNISIRDVPKATRDILAARAAATGKSLQEYLRQKLVELGEKPEASELMAVVRERKAAMGTRLDPDWIVEQKGADRR